MPNAAARDLPDVGSQGTPMRSNGVASAIDTVNPVDPVNSEGQAVATQTEPPAKRPRGRPRGSGKHQRRLASQALGPASSPAGSSGLSFTTPPASASRTRSTARTVTSPMLSLKIEGRSSASAPTSPQKRQAKAVTAKEIIEIGSDSDWEPDLGPSPRENTGDDAYYEMLDAMPSPGSGTISGSKLVLPSNKDKQSPRRRPRTFYPTSAVKLAPAVGSSSTATGYVMVIADGMAIRKGKGKGSVDEVSDQTKEVNGTGSGSGIGSSSSHTHSSPLGPGAVGVVGEKAKAQLVEVDDEKKAVYAAGRVDQRKRKRVSEDAEVSTPGSELLPHTS